MEDYEDLDDAPRIKNHPWKKIIKTVWKDKFDAIGLLITVLFSAITEVGYPFVNQYAINQYFKSNDPARFENVYIYLLVYLAFAIFYGFVTYMFIFFAGRIEAKTSYELRKEAYLNLQKLPFAYFDRTQQGWIMARLTSDARKLSEIISWGITDLLNSFLMMIGIVVVLLVFDARLAVVILIALPVCMTFSLLMNRKILKEYRNARKENSKITAALNEGFMGIKATKSLVIENDKNEEFYRKAKDYKRSSLKAVAFSSIFGPFIYLLCIFSLGTTLYVGSVLAINITVLYLFIEYVLKFFDPIMNIAQILGDFQQASASAERIISLIEEKPEITDREDVIEKYGTIFDPKYENFEELIGDIEFKNVDFEYIKGQRVLDDFNLTVPKGSTVALVGHTGSGKSTVVNLLCRFYEPTSGNILIDGHDYKDRSITWLHSNLGYVLQTPELFTGTIIDNVRYGNLKRSDEDCINALKIVRADEFIEKLPEKYYTSVGEGGNRLSLGEKQLISIARAIVNDPRILIFDEATSSIDTQTEALIQEAINKVLKGRTSFVIAHRLQTIINADMIIVMKDGKIIEAGKHHELLLQKGYYFDLYKTQFESESEQVILNA